MRYGSRGSWASVSFYENIIFPFQEPIEPTGYDASWKWNGFAVLEHVIGSIYSLVVAQFNACCKCALDGQSV